MANTSLALKSGHGEHRLEAEIRQVRQAHAEKLSAIRNVHDAAVLRLSILRDELAPVFAGYPAARRVVDLALVPGDPPRLWIDMTTYVVMSPDPGTYCLRRDSFCRQEVLLQSADRDEIAAAATQHVAGTLVEREKQLQLVSAAEASLGRQDSSAQPSVMLAWLSGLAIGITATAALLQHVLGR